MKNSNLQYKNVQSILKKNNRGFVVLYTVLIAGIILAIAIGITFISYNEVLLSGEAKEGNIAFFAADSGAECALFWDSQDTAFISTPTVTPLCNGTVLSINAGAPDFHTYVFPLFEFNVSLENDTCTRVIVNKESNINNQSFTQIESLGYNVSCGNETSPRAVVRAIRVTYPNP